MLNGQIYVVHHEILYIGELVSDPDSMGCCLDGFAHNLVCGAIHILIIELEFSREGAKYGYLENEGFILRESIP